MNKNMFLTNCQAEKKKNTGRDTKTGIEMAFTLKCSQNTNAIINIFLLKP